MKRSLFAVALAVCVGLGLAYVNWSDDTAQKPADVATMKVSPQLNQQRQTLLASRQAAAPVTEDKSGEAQPATARRYPVTEEQVDRLLEKEADLLVMMKDYETVRADKSARLEHREVMQDKLSAYSKDVLPVAMGLVEARDRQQQ